ncbi:phosphodiester glycosidase family protein [Clostridiaceae bacterium UIB06]|uniref:Phosphodiester glycosidase family protein n=1 Tax=Clostridium thailandense TaxID=2794346 RepID=A0A949WPR5_9CLOT|nr:phosphodiester glycosidase family protein [Clostridium thailandense]MBV7271670.1 phosphodiester glycosidase family protein [Clostridium thailandense]MCH5136359.1 phosphodiester glycosidase family protein [Clostridiaceae bacterium UIB06]
MKNKVYKLKKKKISVVVIILIFIFQVFAASLISCLLVFYGPFPVVRKMIVGTSMSSYKHQYIAKLFLSDSEISKILSSDTESTGSGEQKISNIKINNYQDNSIERYDINSSKFKGYMLVIKNPLMVKVGYTNKLTKEGERTSDIAKDHNAIAAINGGGFMDKSNSGSLWSGTGAYPTGFVFSQGKIVYQDVSDTDQLDVMALDYQGKMIIGSHSINDLKRLKVSEAISFGPSLIINGKATFSGDGGQGITARTAAGQRKDGAILLLVVDGRRINMPGATLHDIQKIMLDYNAYNAINLDGGSSSTMYYKGNVINNPCNPLGERTVATALYVQQ